MTAPPPVLTDAERRQWDDQGFLLRRGWADPAACEAMIDAVVGIARAIDAGDGRDDLMVVPEEALADAPTPEGRVSKVFRLMRSEPAVRAFATEPRLLSLVAALVDTADVDCFLSQFIFKHPGALGQPWHQDEWYFRMDPPAQVGVWLACTDATVDNGPLWVVAGSHREGLHEQVVGDPRPHANAAYVEIVGADTDHEQCLLMERGDLLIFDSHLRHRSTDNVSDGMRAAMVLHYSPAGTTVGHPYTHNQEWIPVWRDGRPVAVDPAPTPIDWGTR